MITDKNEPLVIISFFCVVAMCIAGFLYPHYVGHGNGFMFAFLKMTRDLPDFLGFIAGGACWLAIVVGTPACFFYWLYTRKCKKE